MTLPEITKHPIIYVDATPNSDYPVRILRAYRHNCDCKWASSTEENSSLIDIMNECCDQRAAILDEAIAILEDAKRVSDLLLGKDKENLLYFCTNCRDAFAGPSAYVSLEPPPGYHFGGIFCHSCIEKGKQDNAITP